MCCAILVSKGRPSTPVPRCASHGSSVVSGCTTQRGSAPLVALFFPMLSPRLALRVAISPTADGVKRGTRVAINATCIGVPWQLRPDQRKLARPVVLLAEADQGVARVMPAVPRVGQR